MSPTKPQLKKKPTVRKKPARKTSVGGHLPGTPTIAAPPPKKKPKPKGKGKPKAQTKPKSKVKPAKKLPIIEGPNSMPSVFVCGNHQPGHIAYSVDEMAKLASLHKCRNFHASIFENRLPGDETTDAPPPKRD